jgi:hypothetical protein
MRSIFTRKRTAVLFVADFLNTEELYVDCGKFSTTGETYDAGPWPLPHPI